MHPRRRPSKRKPLPCLPGTAGFPLVEVLIVLVLIGIMAAIAVPRIDVVRFQMDSAMQEVGTRMLAAQRLAVSRQHDIIVTFDVANQRLHIHEDANNSGEIESGEAVSYQTLEHTVVFGRGGASACPYSSLGSSAIAFTHQQDGFPAVIFRRNGSASEEGGFYLTSKRALQGSYPRDTRAVGVERSTGRVSWYSFTGSAWEQGF